MSSLLIVTFVVVCLTAGVINGEDGKLDQSEVASFDQLLVDYDRNKRPNFGYVQADVCEFSIVIYKIGPVREATMGLTTDMYVRQTWTDKRVSEAIMPLFKSMETSNATTTATTTTTATSAPPVNRRFISLTKSTADKIWRPNIYFKDSISETTPHELSQSQFLRVYENGQIRSSRRVLLTTRCSLDLRFFPLDLQMCPICFESYELDDSEQFIKWPDVNELKLDHQSTATFTVEKDVTLTSQTVYWADIGNNYTTLCMEIRLSRKITMYIVTMYLPSVALVILSWVSFWIDKKAVPARAGLTITTILAQITLITGTANKFPGIADLKLGDTYMIVNFFFVFGSLIEFAMVSGQEQQKMRNTPEQKAKEEQKKGANDAELAANDDAVKAALMTSNSPNGAELDCEMKSPEPSLVDQFKKSFNRRFRGDIDLAARVLFPSTFALWNCVYFALGFGLRSY